MSWLEQTQQSGWTGPPYFCCVCNERLIHADPVGAEWRWFKEKRGVPTIIRYDSAIVPGHHSNGQAVLWFAVGPCCAPRWDAETIWHEQCNHLGWPVRGRR